MVSTFWEQVRANGLRVPDDRPLADLTAELTTMLGDPDPAVRDGIAHPTLSAWVREGVYDDLLEGLGDGMAAGLAAGLGEVGTDSVFRRGLSAAVLADCVDRHNRMQLVPADTVLRWGDRVASWLVRERDLRGHVEGRGLAGAVAHGADAVGAVAGSAVMGRMELTVLLDVVADRLLAPTEHHLGHGQVDRLAAATMRILRRDVLEVEVLEPWVARLGHGAVPRPTGEPDPSVAPGNVQTFLRSLHLQLALAPEPPANRTDLLLVLMEELRASNPDLLGRGPLSHPLGTGRTPG